MSIFFFQLRVLIFRKIQFFKGTRLLDTFSFACPVAPADGSGELSTFSSIL